MFGTNEFIGITLEEDYLKYAHIEVDGNVVRLLGLDRVSLKEKIESESSSDFDMEESEEEDSEAIFGLEEEGESGEEEGIDKDLMEGEEDDELMDMTVEAEGEEGMGNGLMLANLMEDINPSRVDLGINVPAGQTIVQVLRDTDYEEVKKKDLREIIENKLESIYGSQKSEEFYEYEIRDDGALILASVEQYAPLLQLVDEAAEFYDGKTFIHDVVPDESALVGLVRTHYDLDEAEITAVIQFENQHCRIVFMKGDQIWQVSPMINEGTSSNSLLNTVFSKLLYQLDTGEVPSLDRILLANNTLGYEAVEFFNENFPDLEVSELKLNPDRFDASNFEDSVVNGFTTAIALAWCVSGLDEEKFPSLTFLPNYVAERQKVFKLQWHGIVLLLLIGLSPIVLNYFYQANASKISQLESQINSKEQQITEVQQTVNSVNKLENDFRSVRQNLTLVDTLMEGSEKWSTTLDMVNGRIQRVNSLWITSLNTVGDGLRIEGISLYRNRITSFVDVFHEAMLDQVNLTSVREEDLYQFTITVQQIVEDEVEFAPDQNQKINELISRR